jgi:hypothetical protein
MLLFIFYLFPMTSNSLPFITSLLSISLSIYYCYNPHSYFITIIKIKIKTISYLTYINIKFSYLQLHPANALQAPFQTNSLSKTLHSSHSAPLFLLSVTPWFKKRLNCWKLLTDPHPSSPKINKNRSANNHNHPPLSKISTASPTPVKLTAGCKGSPLIYTSI